MKLPIKLLMKLSLIAFIIIFLGSIIAFFDDFYNGFNDTFQAKIIRESPRKYAKSTKWATLEEAVEKELIQNKDYNVDGCQIEVMSEVHHITHEKDGTSYKVILFWEFDSEKKTNQNYSITLRDQELTILQSFNLGIDDLLEIEFTKIEFTDINLDGYTDIVVHRGPAVAEKFDLYIWDVPTENFIKVIYEGVIKLPPFEVFDGYIQIFLLDDATKIGRTKKMFWEGNHLIMRNDESNNPPQPLSDEDFIVMNYNTLIALDSKYGDLKTTAKVLSSRSSNEELDYGTYVYENFVVSVALNDTIFFVDVLNWHLETARGIKIFDSLSDVFEIYGQNYSYSDNNNNNDGDYTEVYSYKYNYKTLTFYIDENETVTKISLESV